MIKPRRNWKNRGTLHQQRIHKRVKCVTQVHEDDGMMKIADIARATGISVSRVSQLLRSGLKKVRAHLEKGIV